MRQKGFAPILVILIFLILATLGYIGYSKYFTVLLQKNTFFPTQSTITILSSPTPTTSIPSPSGLQTTSLPNGDIKITNPVAKFEITIPSKYKLLGDVNNFEVQYAGPNSSGGPGLGDQVTLVFRTLKINGSTLLDNVKKDYENMQNNDNQQVNFNDIKKFVLDGITGYSYSCKFLIEQECKYLPLDNRNYLFILVTIDDSRQRGYLAETTKILVSLKFIK